METLFHRWLLRVSDRIFQLVLAAYPSEFRRIYGKPMAQVFRDCCRDIYQQSGAGGVIVLWIAALYDIVVNALGEHISMLLHNFEKKSVVQALLFGKQEQAQFMISSQQCPDAHMFHLLNCPCKVRHLGGPLAL